MRGCATATGEVRTIGARLVVGADGRNSTVARQVRAARYAVLPTERFGYFAYYEDVPFDDPPVVDIVRDERLYGFGMPADAGLYLACVMPPAADHPDFAADIEAGWEREVAQLPRIGELVARGRRAGKPRGLRPVDTYLRVAAGPGWALVGDAGHFKDPSPGQGIADAMRQAERLAETVAEGLERGRLDRRVRSWWRWRDRDARERHAWAHAFGAAGPPPRVLVQAQRDALARPDGPERFWGPSMQRLAPRKAVGPVAMLRATRRSVSSRKLTPTAAAKELAGVVRRDAGYRRAGRRREALA